MSDYRVYLKTSSENIELDIPDIYKDDESDTTVYQLINYLKDKLNVDYDNLQFELKRNGRIKRKCSSDITINDNDEIYFSFCKQIEINPANIDMKVGFNNINQKRYYQYNFMEKDLELKDSKIECTKEYVNKVREEIIDFTKSVEKEEIKKFISSFVVFSNDTFFNESFPFIKSTNGWYFGFLNNGYPNGYGFHYDNDNKIYHEGYFEKNLIYTGKSLYIGKNKYEAYITKCEKYTNFLQSSTGIREYIFHDEFYEGSFKDNYYHMGGCLKTNELDYYGIFKESKFDGYGTCEYKNGELYSGYWFEGRKNTFGILKYNNGNYYNGFWYNDNYDYFGMYYDKSMNITYIGTFENNKRTFNKDEYKLHYGYIFFSDHVGDEHNLNYFRNEAEATYRKINIFRFDNIIIDKEYYHQIKTNIQSYYMGNYNTFKDYSGIGKIFIKHGTASKDLIENNDIIYHKEYFIQKFRDFRSYYSTFKDGLPDGFGIINYENGDRYIGNLKNGMMNGDGVMYKNTGEVIKAFWNNNIKIAVK